VIVGQTITPDIGLTPVKQYKTVTIEAGGAQLADTERSAPPNEPGGESRAMGGP